MTDDARTARRGAAARIAGAVDRLAAWLARHWLAAFNAVVALFVGLPFAAPVLMHAGATGPAQLIYTLYEPTCHQLPERSFFLFGERMVVSVAELEALGALPAGQNLLQRQALRFIGTPEIGYKVAICQRDAAIYGGILLGGLLFAALRTRRRRLGAKLPKLPLWLFGLLLIPIAVDGLGQLFGLRESSWPLRLLTGALAGSGLAWLIYPYVDDSMADVDGPPQGAPKPGPPPA